MLAIVEAVAEGIVNNLVGSGISGSLGAIPAIPLSPLGGGINIDSVILDDLELRCSIIRSSSVPVKNHGQISAPSGWSIDLDTGEVRGEVFANADLTW